ETQAAMLSAATAAPTLADRLDEAVRAVYATEASLEDVAQAARLADQALRSASTDDARSEYAFLAAELERVREGMVALAQVGTQGGPSPAVLDALVEAARGAEASLGDVERAQRAVDAALSAARTDAARQEYAELQEELRQTHRAMTEIARSSFTPPTPGLSELIAVARGAAVSLDDLAAAERAVNAAFAAATTDEARQQYARLAS